ncbi:AP-3 complex subunit delta [Acorus gramineus]|uniref:AP-3 complex subunit delta n=1 Tax=Acorus gramineus TaxID=55184 RepID=A0AAV9BYD5_ACOGR|nr:AP-3 complex subunit delta [Acorus gramineus]
MGASSIVESLMQRTLDDLIKSLRSPTTPIAPAIHRHLDDIRRELRSPDPSTKSTALQKLTYISSLHPPIDPSFASFHAIELLPSSPPFKRHSYLFISLTFPSSHDLLLLLPNQLRKDLSSPNHPDASLALQFLASRASSDLARDLTPEIFTLLNSSKPILRRKATSALVGVFTACPDSVRVCFKRLVENLDSSDDAGVLSAAVGVFCELSRTDPASYLPLAPEFYRVFVDAKRNNWVLIKILKIFAWLCPIEPRLARRVVEPVCDLMRRTMAKSVLLECIRTVFSSLADYEHAVALAVEKNKELLGCDEDANLRYLGLHALSLLGWERYPAVVMECKETIIKSLSDADPNIRRESLRLVMGMVSEGNLVEISRILVGYASKSDPDFCNEIFRSILSVCARNFYELVVDFDWYVSLLGEIARNVNCRHGEEVERQLVDIGMRVEDSRMELVSVARELLMDPALLGNPLLDRVLSAAAWVSGEYVRFSRNPFELVEALLQPRTDFLPPLVRAVYVQSTFKVLVFCLRSYLLQSERESSGESDLEVGDGELDLVGKKSEKRKEIFTHESMKYLLDLVETALGPLLECSDVEILERTRNVLGLVRVVREIQGQNVENEEGFKEGLKTCEIVEFIDAAFSEELGPVSGSAQERVIVPDGLVLRKDLSILDTILPNEDLSLSETFSLRSNKFKEVGRVSQPQTQNNDEPELPSESTSLLVEHRRRHGLYYLPTECENSVPNDYPPANEPLSLLPGSVDATENDLARLAEQSLVSKKPKQVKPRPVVVKLDGDEVSVSAEKLKKDSRETLLSGVVQDVLLGEERKPESSRKKSSDKSSQRRVKNVLKDGETISELQEHVGDGQRQRSRRHKHRTHKEGSSHRSLSKDDDPHSKHKSGQRAICPSNINVQSPVIQDFLL